jgi:hypothetical protein
MHGAAEAAGKSKMGRMGMIESANSTSNTEGAWVKSSNLEFGCEPLRLGPSCYVSTPLGQQEKVAFAARCQSRATRM